MSFEEVQPTPSIQRMQYMTFHSRVEDKQKMLALPLIIRFMHTSHRTKELPPEHQEILWKIPFFCFVFTDARELKRSRPLPISLSD